MAVIQSFGLSQWQCWSWSLLGYYAVFSGKESLIFQRNIVLLSLGWSSSRRGCSWIVRSFEISVTLHRSTWCNIPADLNCQGM